MAKVVRCGLIQAKNEVSSDHSVAEIKKAMNDKHVKMIEDAAKQGVQILCLQEIFNGPYFCAEQTVKWYDSAEPVPGGPTIVLMQEQAKKHKMVIVVPI